MSNLDELLALLTEVSTFSGYAVTGARLPYVTGRALYLDPGEPALDGSAVAWDDQYSLYCSGASVEAADNLARYVMRTLQGARVGGTTVSTSMGYSGAVVEGHYESQVTAQLHQGDI